MLTHNTSQAGDFLSIVMSGIKSNKTDGEILLDVICPEVLTDDDDLILSLINEEL